LPLCAKAGRLDRQSHSGYAQQHGEIGAWIPRTAEAPMQMLAALCRKLKLADLEPAVAVRLGEADAPPHRRIVARFVGRAWIQQDEAARRPLPYIWRLPSARIMDTAPAPQTVVRFLNGYGGWHYPAAATFTRNRP
jgi:hypothetical protein